MATTDEYKALGIKYLNRFLGLDFDGSLETNFYDTPTSIRLEQHIKNLEAEQREARLELLAAKKAHQKVIDERRVRLNKLQLGLTQPVEALLEEVYDRTQRATKLQGADRSYRHELPQAYADIRNFVKNGTYGAHPLEAAGRKWNPVFVTYRAVGFCCQCSASRSGQERIEPEQSSRSRTTSSLGCVQHPRWHSPIHRGTEMLTLPLTGLPQSVILIRVTSKSGAGYV